MKNGEKHIIYFDDQVFNMINKADYLYFFINMVPEDNIDDLVEVTRRPSRATDLYAALYIAPTPFFAHARGTHTREILSVMEAAIQRRRSILSWSVILSVLWRRHNCN
jgi:hypothetical protein